MCVRACAYMRVYVCVYVCAFVHVHACVRVCVRACVCTYTYYILYVVCCVSDFKGKTAHIHDVCTLP